MVGIPTDRDRQEPKLFQSKRCKMLQFTIPKQLSRFNRRPKILSSDPRSWYTAVGVLRAMDLDVAKVIAYSGPSFPLSLARARIMLAALLETLPREPLFFIPLFGFFVCLTPAVISAPVGPAFHALRYCLFPRPHSWSR